ncbi:hypothetical protein BN439_0775 [Erwinia amylovora Ea644]|nr:hypothetical protein BN439_0775 [Erwinia amylovora Ea644]CCP05893.1 hypothetical protein BN440_0842 [Erwinia amylovora MR1]
MLKQAMANLRMIFAHTIQRSYSNIKKLNLAQSKTVIL